ncbi:MAG: hypothetical protein ACLPND_07090, partial [Candidatus Korobacteraceae bacterium]
MNSLLTGKNTGNFADFRAPKLVVIAVSDSFCLVSGTNDRFLCSMEQGIIRAASGNCSGRIRECRFFPAPLVSAASLLAAPLLAGNDLEKTRPEILSILTNREVIAVDQDPFGVQGHRVWIELPSYHLSRGGQILFCPQQALLTLSPSGKFI